MNCIFVASHWSRLWHYSESVDGWKQSGLKFKCQVWCCHFTFCIKRCL